MSQTGKFIRMLMRDYDVDVRNGKRSYILKYNGRVHVMRRHSRHWRPAYEREALRDLGIVVVK